jgi:hypothetical protein
MLVGKEGIEGRSVEAMMGHLHLHSALMLLLLLLLRYGAG